MKKIHYLLILLFPFALIAQVQTETEPQIAPKYVEDGAFIKEHNLNKNEAYKYPDINEKDIVWSKIIWREIDLRQKINHHFYYPAVLNRKYLDYESMSLIDVVMEVLYKQAQYEDQDSTRDGKCHQCDGTGKIPIGNTVLGVQEDSECVMCNNTGNMRRLEAFGLGDVTIPGKEFDWGAMTPQEILNIGIKPPKTLYLKKRFDPQVDSTDEFGKKIPIVGVPEVFDRTQVTSWRIKEEVFFDKKRSVMETRIIGLCPVVPFYVDPKSQDTILNRELFWIYYPDWRGILAKTNVLNLTKNNAQKRSYLDLFEKRMFASRITMENNIMNRQISDYMIGLDALLESDRIKEEIFNIEHDMWEY